MFAHFLGTFKHPICPEILFFVACQHLLLNYAPIVSEVVYCHLEVVVGTLKKGSILALYILKKKNKKIYININIYFLRSMK